MKVLLSALFLFISIQTILTATEKELNDAFEALQNVTNSTVLELEISATNQINHFLYNLAVERLQSKLELQKLVFNLTSSLGQITDSVESFDVDITDCTKNLTDPTAFADNLFYNYLEDCLYDDKYEVGVNIINTHFSGIETRAISYLGCVRDQLGACEAGSSCSDELLEKIKVLQSEVPSNLRLLGVNMGNSLQGIPVRCRENVSMQYNLLISDLLLFVRTCVDAVVAANITPICL